MKGPGGDDAGDGPLRLRIMQPGVNMSYEVSVTLADSVSVLKKKVMAALGCGPDKFVRLIASGKLLAPDHQCLAAFRNQLTAASGPAVIHAVVSLAQTTSPGARAMALTGVSLVATDDSSDSDGGGDEAGQGGVDAAEGRRTSRAGFDRLREVGLNREEIESLRTFFTPQVNAFAGTSTVERQRGSDDDAESDLEVGEENAQQPAESARQRQLRLEDAWIAAQGQSGEFGMNFLGGGDRRLRGALGGAGVFFGASADDDDTLETTGLLGEGTDENAAQRRARRNRDGAGRTLMPFRTAIIPGGGLNDRFNPSESEMGQPRDFVVGFLMGFLLGVIMLFWLWEQGPYRQKMGIMSGVCSQLTLRYVKRSLDAASSADDAAAAEEMTAEGEDVDVDFTTTEGGG